MLLVSILALIALNNPLAVSVWVNRDDAVYEPGENLFVYFSANQGCYLAVYNVEGKLVRVLVDRTRPAGRYEVQWNGTSSSGAPVASGVYFYKLVTKGFAQTKKMVLLK